MKNISKEPSPNQIESNNDDKKKNGNYQHAIKQNETKKNFPFITHNYAMSKDYNASV